MYQSGKDFFQEKKKKRKMNGLQMHLQLIVQKKQPRFDRRRVRGRRRKRKERERGEREKKNS